MHKYENLTPIFIGGTGRSGTTILSKFIGSHDEVVKIPMESRFMIDKNGLIDLFDALSRNYSLDQGRVAIRDFEKKLTKEMSNPYKAPYLGWNFSNVITSKTILNTTNELVNKITSGTFEAVDYNTQDSYSITSTIRRILYPANRVFGKLTEIIFKKRMTFLAPSLGKLKPKEKMYIPQYFSDEEKLLTHFRSFTLDIFSGFFEKEANIKAWSEDTPASILNIDFLQKLFPNAKFINVTRHPVAVAYSMQKMVWAPDSLEKCCNLLEELYNRLIDIHNKFKTYENYLFLRLEDLESQESINKLSEFVTLPISGYSNSIKIEGSKMNYYKSKMPSSDINYASKRLKKAIDFFGYDR
jgi:hypothetical protein